MIDEQNGLLQPLLKLKAIYSNLRKSEKKVADYLLAHPEETIYLSISVLAENCKVSEASVIRLCKALGYVGYQDLKINIAKFMIDPVKSIHEEIIENDSTDELIGKVMRANIGAVEDTMKVLSSSEVERAIDALYHAGRIEFYGLGGSAIVAFDAHHKFFKYARYSIAYDDPHMQAMSAATLKPGDVVVGISHSGNTKDLVDSLSIARNSGATTICITGGVKSPITKVSDIVLMVMSKEQAYKAEPMTSRIAQLSIVDVLAVGVAFKDKERVIESLGKTRSAIKNKRY